MDHKHIYDARGKQLCSTQEEKINADANKKLIIEQQEIDFCDLELLIKEKQVEDHSNGHLSKYRTTIFMFFLSIISSLLFISCTKNVVGLFLSPSDFKNNKLTYAINKDVDSKSNINVSQIFNSKNILVNFDNEKLKLVKDSVFGYKLADSTILRFYNNKTYKILKSSDNIVIYKSTKPLVYSGKTNVTNHYFSLTLNSEIRKLTINNLMADFRDNISFKNSMKSNFKYNSELIEIDNCTNQRRILNFIN